jgi:hypothetical protein
LVSSLSFAQGHIFVQPYGAPVPVPYGYDAQVYTFPDGTSTDISIPCNLPGPPVVITVGSPNAQTIARFPALLAAAKTCPHIIGLDLIDEYGWNGSSYTPGQYAAEVCWAAQATKNAGLMVTFLALGPAVLRDDFIAPPCMSNFDAVTFDYYLSIQPPGPIDTHGCYISSNPTVNAVGCIARKLRQLGAKQVIYTYQAFGLTYEPDYILYSRLLEQREAINRANELGINYIAPWGLYLSQLQMTLEPLRQLHGTWLEPLVIQ